ncbi:MAG: polyprenyl synthetase family protein [Nitrososphaerota archaeon]|nr:polyprenyl synthetase family protein [Nitrososphaerota archaeon]
MIYLFNEVVRYSETASFLELDDAAFASYFKSKTLNYHTRIEHAISDVLGRFSNSAFYEPLNYAIHGGKRVRPLIVLLSYDSVGTGNQLVDNPMPAAIAVELLHTESIIHDDIIDDDSVRREKISFHERFGLNPAILSADFVLGIILDIASQYPDSRIGRELSKSVLRMSEGEYSEYRIQTEGNTITVEQYVEVITNKTASLFQSSSRIGAMIAGAKLQTIESMSEFGLNLGIAYQMQDDLLDWDHKAGLERALDVEQSKLQEMSYKYAVTAKNALSHLGNSESKQRLEELADFAVRRRF